ncbi:MAG: MFS transporter [Hydrogenophilales bacterium 16-64-46]|nr:MAG: MFS transporter [Hydrogenophilales bacterium 12-64-13]OYZ06376.1 MAG: MFS transporter [Hydrogenophilales bacterium 16-64-46]OZA38725.1 MAG: MFS transporter [Hydrogenophilales bacterium 17-64-34]HQT01404.1 MFS transporter [Thiobacillus sp.]
MKSEARFFVIIALVGGFAILSSTMSKTPVLPLFAEALKATPAEIGWIVMASTLPGVLVSYPAGVLSDILGKRRLLVTSLVVFATAPFLYLLVANAWQLMVVRFYHGFATAIFGTVASAAIAERYVADRAARLSTYSSVTIVGRSIAPFLGGALISLASFRAVYLACAVSGVIAFAAGLLLRDKHDTRTPRRELPRFWPSLVTVLKDRGILLVSTVEAAQYLVFGAVEAFLALYASSLGIPAWQIGVILGVQLVSIVFAKPIMGRLSDRVGRPAVIVPGLLVGAVSVALFPLAGGFVSLTVLSLVFGTGFATVTSSTTALVADLTQDGRYGASMGVLRTVMDVGQSIGPVLTGFIIGIAGYGSAFGTLAAVLVLASLLLGALPKPAAP